MALFETLSLTLNKRGYKVKTIYRVKFSKYFVNVNLEGIMVDASLDFPTLDTACQYVAWCHSHAKKPVKAYQSSHYTCHMATIDTINN